MTNPSISPVVEIKTEDLAAFVAALNRFLTRFSAMEAFRDAGLGLAEWSALSVIASKDGLNNRQLSNSLGVSPQRVNQITDSLKATGLISVNSSSDDARVRVIAITSAGTVCLRELNAKLEPKIMDVLRKRPALLLRITKLVNNTLMRIAGPSKADRLVAKQRRRSRIAPK